MKLVGLSVVVGVLVGAGSLLMHDWKYVVVFAEKSQKERVQYLAQESARVGRNDLGSSGVISFKVDTQFQNGIAESASYYLAKKGIALSVEAFIAEVGRKKSTYDRLNVVLNAEGFGDTRAPHYELVGSEFNTATQLARGGYASALGVKGELDVLAATVLMDYIIVDNLVGWVSDGGAVKLHPKRFISGQMPPFDKNYMHSLYPLMQDVGFTGSFDYWHGLLIKRRLDMVELLFRSSDTDFIHVEDIYIYGVYNRFRGRNLANRYIAQSYRNAWKINNTLSIKDWIAILNGQLTISNPDLIVLVRRFPSAKVFNMLYHGKLMKGSHNIAMVRQ